MSGCRNLWGKQPRDQIPDVPNGSLGYRGISKPFHQMLLIAGTRYFPTPAQSPAAPKYLVPTRMAAYQQNSRDRPILRDRGPATRRILENGLSGALDSSELILGVPVQMESSEYHTTHDRIELPGPGKLRVLPSCLSAT